MTLPKAPRNIAADLDQMLKRGSAKQAEVVKKAEEVDAGLAAAEVGKTTPATTGAQAAGIKSEQSQTYAAPAVDAGAQANQPNASVTNSPQGAAASATNGDAGAKAPGEMGSSVTKTTVNADVMGGVEGNDTSGSFKSARAVALAKMADELDALAEKSLPPMTRFLAKSARASTNAEVKKVAEGMDDQDLGQAAGDNLSGQIESQEMSDEEAAQILQEAVQSGAITEEELAAAVAELQGGAGAGADAGAAAAPAGDPAAVMPPADPAAAGDVPPAPAAPGAMDMAAPAADPAKLASADVGPEHPGYLAKVAAAHPTEVAAGHALAAQIWDSINAKPVVAETKVAAAPLIEAKSDDEKLALAAVQKELGIDDSQLKALNEAPSKPMDKHASAALAYRTAILTKLAALA